MIFDKDDDNEDIFLTTLILIFIVCIGLDVLLNIRYLRRLGFSSLLGVIFSMFGYYLYIKYNKKEYRRLKNLDENTDL